MNEKFLPNLSGPEEDHYTILQKCRNGQAIGPRRIEGANGFIACECNGTDKAVHDCQKQVRELLDTRNVKPKNELEVAADALVKVRDFCVVQGKQNILLASKLVRKKGGKTS